MYDYTALDTFSQDFADRLFRAYPGWRRYARVVTDYGSSFLHITVPATGDDGDPLVISTERGEVTVGQGDWHQHFAGALGWAVGQEQEFDRALDAIGDRGSRL